MIDDQLDPVVPSGQRADRERRIAWRTASVIILLNSLLNGIAAVLRARSSPTGSFDPSDGGRYLPHGKSVAR